MAQILLAQDQEIQQLMVRFQASEPNGVAVQQLEVLVRTAIFKPANALVEFLLQAAAERIDAGYQPKVFPRPSRSWTSITPWSTRAKSTC